MRSLTAKVVWLLWAAVLALGKLEPTAAAAATTAAPARSGPQPVIIDTDVGDDIDDAFALAVALQDPAWK